jgi:hypothetical protein
MFPSRRGSLSAPVINHGKFVLSFLLYCYKCVHVEKLMCGSAEKFHPFYAAAVFP